MDRRAIPDHQQLARNLAHELLQKTYRILSLEGALLLGHEKLAIEGYGAHRRKVISCEVLLENGCPPHRGVSANHHRQQVETGLIGEHDRPSLLQCPFLREGQRFSFQCSMASSSL